MKRISAKCLFGAFLLLLGSFSLTARTIALESVPQTKKVKITLKSLSKQLNVMVIDAEESILLEQKLLPQEELVNQIIDLTNLPKGKYEILIKTSIKEIVQPIQLIDKNCVLKDYLRHEHFKPVVIQHDDYFDVSWMGQRIGDFSLNLLDKSGNSIFKDESNGVLRVQRRYRLDQMAEGNYLVKIKTPYKTYFEELEIK